MNKYMIIPLIFLLTACGGGGSTEPETPVVITPPPNHPAQGTILSESCDGYTLIQEIADGNGGSTQEETPNSEECGYEPPPVFGTPIGESYCGRSLAEDRFLQLLESVSHALGDDRYQDYADGEGGVYTERTVHLDQSCFVQMDKPADCPTDATDTGDSRYGYMTCDGIKQKSEVDFPYEEWWDSEDNQQTAVIDMLFVVDTNLSEEERDGMTVEEFVDRQIFEANHMYDISKTGVRIRRAGIKMVDVASGDLYRQYAAFFNARYEFTGLDNWQREAEADLVFLFKSRPEEPIACGVANLDATRGIDKTRGIIQCYHNSVFQEAENTRYYQRAHETFAHELGHLLGAQHEYNDALNNWGLFEFSYGYNLPGYNPQADNPDYEGIYGGFGTIMTYADLPTGRFSDRSLTCYFPDEAGEYAGQAVQFGTEGGCFCLDPIEDQPPPTDNVDNLRRTRYLMSQLHEMEHSAQFSPYNMSNFKMDGLTLEEEPEICLF